MLKPAILASLLLVARGFAVPEIIARWRENAELGEHFGKAEIHLG